MSEEKRFSIEEQAIRIVGFISSNEKGTFEVRYNSQQDVVNLMLEVAAILQGKPFKADVSNGRWFGIWGIKG